MLSSTLCTVMIVAQCPKKNYNFWKDAIVKETFNTSVGTLIKCNGEFLILTCSHGIENSTNIHIYIGDHDKYKAKIRIISPELDLGLLEVINLNIDGVNNNNIINFDTYNKNKVIEHKIGDVINIISKKINEKKIKKNILNGVINNIYIGDGIGLTSIKLPYYDILLEKKLFKNIESIKSLSGSIVLNNNNRVVGIISKISQDSPHIIISPYICIEKFLNEYMYNNKFSGLYNIPLVTDAIPVTSDITGLHVKKTFGIIYDSKTDILGKSKKKKILNNDIIVKVNNEYLNKNGNIYCDEFGIEFPLSTYIAIFSHKSKFINLSVYRKNGSSHELIDINILPRLNKTMIYIPKITNQYYKYNGFIFIELSINMIENLYLHNKYLAGSCVEKYQNSPFRNDSSQKIVVIIDSNGECSESVKFGLHPNFPFIKINKKKNIYALPVVVKVNNVKIKNLDHFIDILKINYKNTLNFNIANSTKRKIVLFNK
jgi:hypothetical protein